jgi:hypothetical protein
MDKIPKAIIAGLPGRLMAEINSCLCGVCLCGPRRHRMTRGPACLVLCWSPSLTADSVKVPGPQGKYYYSTHQEIGALIDNLSRR